MLHFEHFLLDFTVCQSTRLGVSSIERAKQGVYLYVISTCTKILCAAQNAFKTVKLLLKCLAITLRYQCKLELKLYKALNIHAFFLFDSNRLESRADPD